jgi:hypothetical protein
VAQLGSSPHHTQLDIMILLKRVATSLVLFVFFFAVLYFAICFIGGAISGGMAGASDPRHAAEAGRQAGVDFVRHHLPAILLSSFGLSFVCSLVLSFSGILPWCRKPARHPQL